MPVGRTSMPSRQQDDPQPNSGAAAELPSTSLAAGDATLPMPDAGPVQNAPPAAASEPPESFGRYLVVQSIGHGAFGDVYRGYDPQLLRVVALKAPRRRLAD